MNINNGDDNGTGSGGSGSGAGGAGGGAGSGGLVKTDTIWKDFESNIKSLYQLGSVIGDTLSRDKWKALTGIACNKKQEISEPDLLNF